jgi:hypothetical protein
VRLIATALALAIAAIGAVGVASPSHLLAFAQSLSEPIAIYAVAAVRVAFGVVLVLAAPGSRMPKTLRVIGIVIIIVGALTPFFGLEQAQALLSWWTSQPLWVMRAWSVLAIAFGAFVAYAVRPRIETAA